MNDNYTNSNNEGKCGGKYFGGHVGICNTVEHWHGNVQEQLENQIYSPDDIVLFISAEESTKIDQDIEIASKTCSFSL